MLVGEVRIAEDVDFDRLRNLIDVDVGWNEEYRNKGVIVWTKIPKPITNNREDDESKEDKKKDFKMIKVRASFVDVKPEVLYDVLHDPIYRKLWDTYMLDSKEIGHLNPNNDICYYAVQSPPPMKNRDFVLLRSWLQTQSEYLITNHSVFYEDVPPKKGFVRAVSHLTGFVVRSDKTNGCMMGYVSHSDPKGSLPIWLVNKVTQVFAPKMVKRLHKACLGYEDWKRVNDPKLKPWLFPEQMTCPKIHLDRFLKEDLHKSTESVDGSSTVDVAEEAEENGTF